jgi:hypothetical protein
LSLYPRPARPYTTARLALLAVVIAGICLGLAAPASAILWRVSKNHVVSYAGIVGKAHPTNVTRPAGPRNVSKFDKVNGNLDYSGGPVMPSSTNYVFVWRPAGWSTNFDEGVNSQNQTEGCGAANSQGQFPACLGYEAGVAQFFQDIAAASGQTTNSDAVATQYNDAFGHTAGGPGPGHYSASYGGMIVDTDPYPANACPGAPQGGRCLTDAQIQAELQKYLSQHGKPAGFTNEYFLITPPDVASCIGRDSQGVWQCAGNAVKSNSVNTAFCAYHSRTATAGHYIYANVPDLDNVVGCDPFVTGAQNNALCEVYVCIWNQSTAEGVISAISHEHNESVTDPEPNNAWTDWGSQSGGENGDKCNNDGLDDPNEVDDRSNGNDGLAQVTPYNEFIHGHYYLIQREWSNDGQQCLDGWSLLLGETFPAPTFRLVGRNGTTLAFNAGASCTGNAACPSGSLYVWQFNDRPFGGQNHTLESSSPAFVHKFPARGIYRVALTVMGPTGLSRGVAQNFRVYVNPVVNISATTNRVAKARIGFSSKGTTHDPALTIKHYLWHFGDGSTSTKANPPHVYARAGKYRVSLTVTDSAGQKGTAAGFITIKQRTARTRSRRLATSRVGRARLIARGPR